VSALLDDALARAQGERPTQVKLRVTPDGERSSVIRDAVMKFAFAVDHDEAGPAAARLADKLSGAMDLRSFSGLLLVAGYRQNASHTSREVALWVFPQDEMLQFDTAQHRIAVIKDAFSRTSHQRKLALLKGRNLRGQFHTADVLDFQSRGRVGALAAFWIDEFLEADTLLSDTAGTRFTADVFVETSSKLTDAADLDQLQAAVITLRNTPVQSRSIDEIADDLLEGRAKEVFLSQSAARLPDPAARRTRFRLERDEFADTVGYRMFRTQSGAQVLAPLASAGQTWHLDERLPATDPKITRPCGRIPGTDRVDADLAPSAEQWTA
jgi:hypothetical protein